ncbi:MAG: thioredoxin domain-containing protein [Phototrophicales bacterium]|nr:thioredoxin domain-containing protein [Phototrophicales bacterium]
MSWFNQFSYPIFAVIILIGAVLLMRRFKVKLPVMGGLTILLMALIFALYIALRPGISTVNSPQEAYDLIGNGRPTLVVFHSNFCTGCLAMNPAIIALADDIRADYNIVRVDIHTQTGQILTQELGFDVSPEFVLYSPTGEEIWRSNGLPTKNTLQIALGES